MRHGIHPGSRVRALAVVLVALAGEVSAAGSGWEGAELTAFGAGTVLLARRPKVPFVPNLRFDFDAGSEDDSGTGTLTAYNESGSVSLGAVPFAWEEKGRSGFKAALDPDEFGGLLGDLIEEATGSRAEVSLTTVTGSGRRSGDEVRIRFAAKGRGTVLLDGNSQVKLRVKVRCR